VDFDLRPGGRYLFRFPGKDDDLAGGVIRACDPPRLLSFELNGAGGDTVLTWILRPQDGGCHLTFIQDGLTPPWFFGGMAGWHGMIDDLVYFTQDMPLTDNEAYMPRWNHYNRLWGSKVPGWDSRTPLRHHEPDGLITPAGDGAYDIRFTRRYKLPIETVWAALTEPARLADWFGQTAIDLRVGGEVAITWPVSGYTQRHVILALDPPHLMVWGPADGQADGPVIRWQLYQEDPELLGVRLVLTNTLIPAAHLLSVGVGWHAHLHELPDAALRATPQPWTADHERVRAERERTQLEPRYRAQMPPDADVPWTH
jgi:uncharacterized protein YndB with AHSA1/START domain